MNDKRAGTSPSNAATEDFEVSDSEIQGSEWRCNAVPTLADRDLYEWDSAGAPLPGCFLFL